MDISTTIAPKSDQLNADDLISGPATVTITGVSSGDADQPVNIATAEFGDARPFKPCKSMRRVLVAAWGPEASMYVGRRMTLYREAAVKFGGQEVGGIRISHLSHIDKRLTLALTMTRGKRAPFSVEPLPDEPAQPERISDDTAADFARDIAESATLTELDQIASDLKTSNLGTHRKRLQEAWAARRAEIHSHDENKDEATS